MASAAFLLAPITTVPHESDDEWESRYGSWNWLVQERWESFSRRLPAAERKLARGLFRAMRTTSNFASFRHLDDRELRRSAGRWVEESYRAWLAENRTSPPPNNGPAEFEIATGVASGIALGDLIHYRGGFRKLPRRSLRPGVALGLLSNKGRIDEFSLGSAADFELTAFHEIARAHGGEHLAVWTYGRAVHLWYARSPRPKAPPEIVRVGFRLRPPGVSPRDAGMWSRLRERLGDSVFALDWDELRTQLDAPEISVSRWFEACGISGANELIPVDHEALWDLLERVGLDLLRGEPVDVALLRQLDRVLGSVDDDSRLAPRRRSPATARLVAGAVHALTEAVGPSREPRWIERARAAAWYWDITDGPALERLTVGVDEAGFGASASLGRLLGHYPPELARDPIFLALAAQQAEAANGHAFVEPLEHLSEHAGTAGFHLAVYPLQHDGAFRDAFGLIEGEAAAQHPEWAGHGFVDLPGLVTGDLDEALRRWFAGERCDGHLLRAEPDGSWRATSFRSGQPVSSSLRIEAARLERAARDLDLRRACLAAGLPDLLEPGAWEEGAYDGSAHAPDRDPQQTIAAAALARRAPPLEIGSWDDIVARWRPILRYRGEREHHEDGIVSLRIAPAPVDPAFLDQIRRDLDGDDLVEGYGRSWTAGRAVCAYTRSDLDLRLLEAIVADTPRPIDITIDLADEGRADYRLISA